MKKAPYKVLETWAKGKRKKNYYFQNEREAFEKMHNISYGETTTMFELENGKYKGKRKNKKSILWNT